MRLKLDVDGALRFLARLTVLVDGAGHAAVLIQCQTEPSRDEQGQGTEVIFNLQRAIGGDCIAAGEIDGEVTEIGLHTAAAQDGSPDYGAIITEIHLTMQITLGASALMVCLSAFLFGFLKLLPAESPVAEDIRKQAQAPQNQCSGNDDIPAEVQRQ